MSRADPARATLDEQVLAWLREPDWREDEARFDALARELFAFQVAHCAPWARFCAGRGVSPAAVTSWREIPPAPTGAFKELALRSFPEARTVHTFRTSGTAAERRGALHLDTLALYEASLRPSFERFVLPDVAEGARVRLLVLAPPAEEFPDSSLSHMFGVLLRARGDEASGCFVRDGALELGALLAALEKAVAEGVPAVLAGTAFAFVHLLDALGERGARVALPPGSRAMETGGFKGRARETDRALLHAKIEAGLGIPAARVVNQYGMTELASQFHDTVLREPGVPRRKQGPPWTRVRILDPASGADVADGEPGAIVVLDLANTGSVCAVQTADLGRRVGDGFEVLGREPGAEARGCSIASDLMLGGGDR